MSQQKNRNYNWVQIAPIYPKIFFYLLLSEKLEIVVLAIRPRVVFVEGSDCAIISFRSQVCVALSTAKVILMISTTTGIHPV